jgi:hypothetical protein
MWSSAMTGRPMIDPIAHGASSGGSMSIPAIGIVSAIDASQNHPRSASPTSPGGACGHQPACVAAAPSCGKSSRPVGAASVYVMAVVPAWVEEPGHLLAGAGAVDDLVVDDSVDSEEEILGDGDVEAGGGPSNIWRETVIVPAAVPTGSGTAALTQSAVATAPCSADCMPAAEPVVRRPITTVRPSGGSG